MKSRTKCIITTEQVKKITGIHFPNASIESITDLADGMFNTAFLIKGNECLSNGIVLKIGPEPSAETLTYEQNILRTEIDVYSLLRDKPVPIPKIYAYDLSRQNIPCDYFFMERVSGQTWKSLGKKIPKDNRPELMRELGRCNAAVHSVKGDYFGYIKEDTRFHFDSWSKAFSAMMNDILEDGERRSYAIPYGKIRAILQKYEPVLDEVSIPKLVDFDMWSGNVFLDKNESYYISGVVDFERCFFGDPFADFTSAMMLFSDVEKEKDFQRGYCEVSNTPFVISENDRIRMNLYRLYMAVIMMVETYRYSKAYAMAVKGAFKSKINKYIASLT